MSPMSASLTVKICGLSTPATLEAALDAGADMVGFVFAGLFNNSSYVIMLAG